MNWLDDPVLRGLTKTAISIVIGLLVWWIGRFVIGRLVRRVREGSAVFHKRGLRWVQPVLRPLDSERRVQRAETVGSILSSLLSVVVVVIVGLYILLAFEVNVGPLLASLGIVGVAVGFGCQQLIRDFLAGIFITIEDQYGIGDVIETSEVVGEVESVGLRITRVRAKDGAIWYLRNGEILRVGNRSQGDYQDPDESEEASSPHSPLPPRSALPERSTESEHSNEPAKSEKPAQRAGE
ncbi:mechanosensitive ion channel family protein [Psychromicrobium lacuslunae]|uniref:mechanosensitive ion channel family protein n=1 Tax=Psychromicrobium lacuslunae TaxID=1618207 RepID=UPI0005D371C4|nr:mechanosensitive ion channel domain-containing protein [Psychromicrobium lacuslunae]